MFDIEDYDYHLPSECIAQEPAGCRDESRLLVVAGDGELTDLMFSGLAGLLRSGDLLVVNDTKVFPARLEGRKESGGKVEMFLLGYPVTGGEEGRAEAVCLLKSSKRPRPGSLLFFGGGLSCEVLELLSNGKVRVSLSFDGDLDVLLNDHGRIPLPPYIRRGEEDSSGDQERYQTVYAKEVGAVAAPTAGLHFTPELIRTTKDLGVKVASVTLHVGYGTFSPVRVEDIREHDIHQEYVMVSEETAALVNQTRQAGGRVWAVGTTTVRALEDAADKEGLVREKEGWCGLYIYPGYHFKVVDNLITNFHLPRSSLLFLVSALAGYSRMMKAYEYAIKNGYRFYSYGDAMARVWDP